jgi:diacylglycerol kinase
MLRRQSGGFLAGQVQSSPDIGRIRDFGSTAVFCALGFTGMVWLTALAVRCGLL